MRNQRRRRHEAPSAVRRRSFRLGMNVIGDVDPGLRRLFSGLTPAEAEWLMQGVIETAEVLSEHHGVAIRRVDFGRLAKWIETH